MIELQDEGVGLAAVHAWVLREVRDDEDGILLGYPLLSGGGPVDIPLPVSCVMTLLVCPPARSAVIVTLTNCPAAPRKVV